MENESRISQLWSNLTEWLNQQDWFLQLKAKWEELDPQSRLYLKAGAAAGSALLMLVLLVSAMWSVHSLKSELADKEELLTQIQNANDELHTLREQTAGGAAAAGSATGTWTAYFESVGQQAGLDKTTLNVSNDKPGAASEQAKETLYDVSLKHVSIKQVVRFAYGIENGARPVKLRNLSIDTKADPAGYMDATLSVSGFALVSK